MLPFALLIASTVCGLLGASLYTGMLCGLGLAAIAMAERTELFERAAAVGSVGMSPMAAMGSLLFGQCASVGTFAAGRLLGALLLAG